MGRFEESIENYRQALAKNPSFNFSYVGIGNNQLFMGEPEMARETFGQLYKAALNDAERRLALFWTAASHLHEGDYDSGLQKVGEMYAIASATDDKFTIAGDLTLMGNILLEKGDLDGAAAEYGESVEMMEQAEVSEEVKEGARRAHLFNQARVALEQGVLETASAKTEEYRNEVAARQVAFEVRQVHELAGALALEQADYDTALAELAQANQQNPRVLYRQALACQGAEDDERMREFATKAANFNGLNVNYAYVKSKAQGMLGEN
jgi:tetratricopeptide (TPR) repeat protein